MTQPQIELGGPYAAWHGSARRGDLIGPAGRTPILAVLGPEGGGHDAVDRARAAGQGALSLSGDHVLHLLHIGPAGGRVAFAYAYEPVISLGMATSEERLQLSAAASAEVVAELAEALRTLGAASYRGHPGPEPQDVLVDAQGVVRVAGFASPWPRPPSMRAPGESSDEAALVYRLGVLLSLLVGGVAPSGASERDVHDGEVRRAVIAAMTRPGPVITDRYANWLRAMMAWEPSERPSLGTLPAGLRKAAQDVGGETLSEWAQDHVDDVRMRTPHDEDALDLSDDETAGPGDPLFHDLSAFGNAEDPTEWGPEVPATVVGDDPLGSQPAPLKLEKPGMPVQIGPPPEAVKHRPKLPTGFLDDDAPSTDTEAHVDLTDDWKSDTGSAAGPARRFSVVGLVLALLWVLAMLGLVAVAVVLFLFLLLYPMGPGSDVPTGPSLDEVM